MSVESIQSQDAPPLETFRILYKTGERDHIRAYKIRFPARGADQIRFLNDDGTENDQIFVSAPEVASVIPYSVIVEAPLIVEVQSQLSALASRVDSLESFKDNLANIVKQALSAALTERGL